MKYRLTRTLESILYYGLAEANTFKEFDDKLRKMFIGWERFEYRTMNSSKSDDYHSYLQDLVNNYDGGHDFETMTTFDEFTTSKKPGITDDYFGDEPLIYIAEDAVSQLSHSVEDAYKFHFIVDGVHDTDFYQLINKYLDNKVRISGKTVFIKSKLIFDICDMFSVNDPYHYFFKYIHDKIGDEFLIIEDDKSFITIKNNQPHSFDDLPAIVFPGRVEVEWYKHGQLHRNDDKPAKYLDWYTGELLEQSFINGVEQEKPRTFIKDTVIEKNMITYRKKLKERFKN